MSAPAEPCTTYIGACGLINSDYVLPCFKALPL